MKRLFLLIVLVACFNGIKAQTFPLNLPKYDFKPWHFGFTLGFNTMNLRVYPVDYEVINKNLLLIEPISSQGFNIGIVVNKRIFDFLDVRVVPTLSFGERQIRYTFIENDTQQVTYLKKIESTYLDIPFTIKYKSKRLPGRFNNVSTYILLGARYSYDFASQKDKDNNNGVVVVKLNPNDFAGTFGVGFDFYMQYFKFGVELQTSYGISNLLVKENNDFALNIDKLKSRIFWVTFTFE